jgi:hypothetical protein
VYFDPNFIFKPQLTAQSAGILKIKVSLTSFIYLFFFFKNIGSAFPVKQKIKKTLALGILAVALKFKQNTVLSRNVCFNTLEIKVINSHVQKFTGFDHFTI